METMEIKKFKMPQELMNIDPVIISKLFPDVVVTVDEAKCSCNKAVFTIEYYPGYTFPQTPATEKGPVAYKRIDWKIIDMIHNEPITVARGFVSMPMKGGQCTCMIEWPMPADYTGSGFKNEITIIADPYNMIRERMEMNNKVTFTCPCK
ncbi:MAG: hypothetical protein ACM3N9_05460 [Syntrophothermus sp.]